MLRKPKLNKSIVVGEGHFPVDESFQTLFPSLYAFLTADKWPEDGSERIPGTALFFMQDGAIKLMLRDKELGVIAFWTASCFQRLLEVVEADLDEGSGDWRKDRAAPAARKPRASS